MKTGHRWSTKAADTTDHHALDAEGRIIPWKNALPSAMTTGMYYILKAAHHKQGQTRLVTTSYPNASDMLHAN
jgi:hypothetical protein